MAEWFRSIAPPGIYEGVSGRCQPMRPRAALACAAASASLAADRWLVRGLRRGDRDARSVTARTPLVLLPGLLLDAGTWRHQIDDLAGVAEVSVGDLAPLERPAAVSAHLRQWLSR